MFKNLFKCYSSDIAILMMCIYIVFVSRWIWYRTEGKEEKVGPR